MGSLPQADSAEIPIGDLKKRGVGSEKARQLPKLPHSQLTMTNSPRKKKGAVAMCRPAAPVPPTKPRTTSRNSEPDSPKHANPVSYSSRTIRAYVNAGPDTSVRCIHKLRRVSESDADGVN